jgi:hypothetical protein
MAETDVSGKLCSLRVRDVDEVEQLGNPLMSRLLPLLTAYVFMARRLGAAVTLPSQKRNDSTRIK